MPVQIRALAWALAYAESMRSAAGWPTRESSDRLGSGERAQTETEKSVESPSWTANLRTEREDSPEAKDSSRAGMVGRFLSSGSPRRAGAGRRIRGDSLEKA